MLQYYRRPCPLHSCPPLPFTNYCLPALFCSPASTPCDHPFCQHPACPCPLLLCVQATGLPFWDETHDFEGWFLVGGHAGLADLAVLQISAGVLQRQPCHNPVALAE